MRFSGHIAKWLAQRLNPFVWRFLSDKVGFGVSYCQQKSLFTLRDRKQRQNVILTSDFNSPNIHCKMLDITGNVSTSERLLEIIDRYSLFQMAVREESHQSPQNDKT